jgi:RNA polymerase sigma-70 factor (ECF subfamily)
MTPATETAARCRTLRAPPAPPRRRSARGFARGAALAYARRVMDAPDEDAALVRLAQGGDERAFEALVVKYQRRIARHVARYLKRAADVEDVVQDVFIRAYRGLGAFRGDSAFYSWLYRIASNAALNFLKRERAPLQLADDSGAERADGPFVPGQSDAQSPERVLMARQISEAVEKALARLQPELAEALMLYEVEGKPYKEIAAMLGIPIGTVRTRIFRAREFIAQRLEPVLGPARDRRW